MNRNGQVHVGSCPNNEGEAVSICTPVNRPMSFFRFQLLFLSLRSSRLYLCLIGVWIYLKKRELESFPGRQETLGQLIIWFTWLHSWNTGTSMLEKKVPGRPWQILSLDTSIASRNQILVCGILDFNLQDVDRLSLMGYVPSWRKLLPVATGILPCEGRVPLAMLTNLCLLLAKLSSLSHFLDFFYARDCYANSNNPHIPK